MQSYATILRSISIHTLCEEGDNNSSVLVDLGTVISIHTLCEEGDIVHTAPSPTVSISIHTLCEEGDKTDNQNKNDDLLISIHTLCEEGDSNMHLKSEL